MDPEAILRLLYAEIEKGNFSDFGNWLRDYGAELSIEQRREVTYRAMYATIEAGKFDLFLKLYKRYSSEHATNNKECVAMVHSAIYASIKQGAFSEAKTLLEFYDSELISREMVNMLKEMIDEAYAILVINLITCPECVMRMKSVLLSWASDQCKKIAEAYRTKTIQQAVQAQGQAIIEVKSIASAMNQVILAYQDVPPAEQNVVQEEEVQPKEVRVRKALADLYCTVEHAHRTFLSKHTALHQ
jgi:hypothetical protein